MSGVQNKRKGSMEKKKKKDDEEREETKGKR